MNYTHKELDELVESIGLGDKIDYLNAKRIERERNMKRIMEIDKEIKRVAEEIANKILEYKE